LDELAVTTTDDPVRAGLLRRGFVLEYVTLGWNDPAAGYVLVYYAAREVREIFFGGH
jgi:hypothetical protein